MPDVNTKQKIADALMLLSKEKSIDKITVKDLVNECGISRQSFYYHYQDIFEVSEYLLRQDMEDMLKRSSSMEDAESEIRVFVYQVLKNKYLIRRLYYSDRRDRLEKILIEAMRDYISAVLQRKNSGMEMSAKELDFVLDFYSIGITEYMILNIDDLPDEAVLMNQFFRLMDGQLSILKGNN